MGFLPNKNNYLMFIFKSLSFCWAEWSLSSVCWTSFPMTCVLDRKASTSLRSRISGFNPLSLVSVTSFDKTFKIPKNAVNMVNFTSFSDRKRGLSPSTEISVLTFVVKKVQWKVQWSFPGCLFLENRRENLKLNVALVVVLVLESKALYYKRR